MRSFLPRLLVLACLVLIPAIAHAGRSARQYEQPFLSIGTSF